MLSTSTSSKGKAKAIDLPELKEQSSEQSDSDSSSSSDSDLSDSEEEQETAPQSSLLTKASRKAADIDEINEPGTEIDQGEDMIILQDETLRPLPSLDPGNLFDPYIKLGETRLDGPSSIRDPGLERLMKAASTIFAPAPPLPPPELTKSGRPLTKKEKKESKQKTAGPDWFDLPAPAEAELPRLYREVEAMRLRNQLDPKRFYKKDEGEGKGISGLPKYFAIGTILPTNTPFGTASSDNLTRASRKRTLVDELVDDTEAKRYAKKKFEELQSTRGAKGKNTLRAKQALRKSKW